MFAGMLPAWDEKLLPEGQAANSQNVYLYSGALTGWRKPKLLRDLSGVVTTHYAYRIPNKDTNDTRITAPDSHWMEFTDPDTTVMHSPVVQDEWHRFYFANPHSGPMYNTYDRIVAGSPAWVLGVPASGCPPGVSVEGGGDAMIVGFPESTVDSHADLPYIGGNLILMVPFVATGSMVIDSVSFLPFGFDGTLSFKAVVYDDDGGKPFELLGKGALTTTTVSGSVATSAFLNSISVIANTKYWIGIFTDGPYYIRLADGTTQGTAYAATFSNEVPTSLNAGTVGTGYATTTIWANLLGASVFEARGYVYTWVTEYGEEGPPTDPVVVNGWANATWTITLSQPTVENIGQSNSIRFITKTRIYRTISNQSGMGTYFLVAEVPVAQGVYVDVLGDDVVALNAQMVSLYWYGPPSDLQSIQAFPNGIAVGFRSNEVWFCEAYRPHAWPPSYVLTTEFPIVGLGVCGQSIVVCTQGTPYLINGVNPASMALTKINLPEPCLHRGSIVATDTAVLYVSPNGLIQINQSGSGSNITEGWISREKWQKLTPQERVRAIKLASSYFAFGVDSTPEALIQRGFTVELSSEDRTSFTIWPQAGGHRLGFNQLTLPDIYPILNVMLDPWTGTGLLIQNNGVYYYDFSDQHPTVIPYIWRSKTYQQQAKRNFAAMRIFFDVPDTTPPQVARDTSFPQLTLGPNQYAIVRIYVDGVLWCTREVRTSGELLRVFSGIKGEFWSFELEGRITISNMQVATSVKELALT
jgi:hypothetical protein